MIATFSEGHLYHKSVIVTVLHISGSQGSGFVPIPKKWGLAYMGLEDNCIEVTIQY